MGYEKQRQQVEIEVKAVKPDLSGIEQTQAGLLSLKQLLGDIEKMASSTAFSKGYETNINRLTETFKRLQASTGSLHLDKVAEAVGLQAKSLQAYVDAQKNMAGFAKGTNEFLRPSVAAAAAAAVGRQENVNQAGVQAALKAFFSGRSGVVQVVAGGASNQAAAVVHSSPIGDVDIAGEAAEAAGSRSSKSRLEQASGPEIRRKVVETRRGAKQVITHLEEFGVTVTDTLNKAGEVIRKVTNDPAGARAMQEFRTRKALLNKQLAAAKASGLDPTEAYQYHATQLGGILTPDLERLLGPTESARLRELLDADAMVSLGRADGQVRKRRKAGMRQAKQRFEQEERDKRAKAKSGADYESWWGQVKDEQDEGLAWLQAEANRTAAQAEAAEEARRKEEVKRAKELRRRENYESWWRQEKDRQDKKDAKPPKPSAWQQAFNSFTPGGFALNTMKVTGWAAAVQGLYSTAAAVGYGVSEAVGTQAQQTRLGQVFREEGGSTKELTQDVLRLTAALGRNRQEAGEAATEWARLGGTKVQVNEQVEVSLKAANVAEISAGEATEYLSAMMSGFQLRVEELNGVLGMLNNTSNTYNVRNKQILDGITKVGSVAKQAGLSLAELQGLIAGPVGKTGQTGAAMGTALKSLIVSMSNPDVQDSLRQRYGFEIIANKTGEIKRMDQALGDLWVTYMKLNDAERQFLLYQVAGKTQASRVAAMMQSYAKSQELAYQGTLNLNSAETENAKILNTVGARWQGLKTSFGRATFTAAQQSGALDLTTQIFRNTQLTMDEVSDWMAGSKIFDGGWKNPLSWIGLNPKMQAEALRRRAEKIEGPIGVKRDSLMHQMSAEEARADGLGIKQRHFDRLARLAETRPDLVAGINLSRFGYEGEKSPALLRAEAASARIEAQKATAAAYSAQSKALELVDAEIEKVTKSRGSASRLEQLEKRRNEIAQRHDQALEFLDADMGEGVKQASLNRESILRGTADAVGGGIEFAQTSYGRLAQRRSSLRSQEKFLLSERRTYDGRDSDVMEAITQGLSKVRSAMAFADSPAARFSAMVEDRRGLAARFASMEFNSYGYGSTEAERLGRREEKLWSEVQRDRERRTAGSLPGFSDSENIRALMAEKALMETQLKIQEQIVELRTEEKQIIEASQREMARSIMRSGPDELLRKLAVSERHRSGNGELSIGQMLGMGPEAYGDLEMLTGGEALRQNRRDQALLHGRGMGMDEAERRQAEVDAWVEKIGHQMGEVLPGHLAEFGYRMSSISTTVESVRQALERFLGTLNGAGGAPPVTGSGTLK